MGTRNMGGGIKTNKTTYTCENGFSSTWGTEYRNLGSNVGQVINFYSAEDEEKCKTDCEVLGGRTYNYHSSGKNCRCYSQAAGEDITLTTDGTWNFCQGTVSE